MRWKPDPRNHGELLLLAQGRIVARVAPQRGRYVAHLRYARVHLLAVFSRRREAQRFVERELWSEAGELTA